MIAILLLYRLVSTLVSPGTLFSRVVKITFGAIYALILVITVLVAAQRLGYNVEGLGGVAILLVIVGAVIVFFLVPFLPRLPFVPGDMVKIRGVMGVVEAITAYQTVLRTFDGQTVYFPSALVMAGDISNYSQVPERRVELNVEINADDDLERARQLLLEIMRGQDAALDEPEPAVFITGIEDGRAALFAFCWVKNADWFATRDALWVGVSEAFAAEPSVSLAPPRLSVSQ
jgi:small conductance mechanosensitive channel